jgi:hypothetical protein
MEDTKAHTGLSAMPDRSNKAANFGVEWVPSLLRTPEVILKVGHDHFSHYSDKATKWKAEKSEFEPW